MYRPSLDSMIPLILLIPTYSQSYGVTIKTYPTIAKGEQIFGTFKTYGGSEKVVDGLCSIEDTAVVETWYRPDITSGCRICPASTGNVYEIINEPENVDMRCQFLKFKVRRVKGGA